MYYFIGCGFDYTDYTFMIHRILHFEI